MSNFEVLVEDVQEVLEHPDADRLSLVRINGFYVVSAKLEDGSPRYKVGDLVAYIPEGAILPEWLLKEMDFWDDEKGIGRLNGSKGNRVKAMKLRGVVSQGVLYPLCGLTNEETGVHYRKWIKGSDGYVHKTGLGFDVADILGVTKYEPEIPSSMSGEVFSHSHSLIYKFDVENAQKYTDVFGPDDMINVTEKLHGTFTGLIFTAEERPDFLVFETEKGPIYATAYSKGLGMKGLCFKATESNLEKNIYMRSLKNFLDTRSPEQLNAFRHYLGNNNVVIMGETFGLGIQDLGYNTKPKFLAFDTVANKAVDSYGLFMEKQAVLGFDTVPLLYRGRYADADLNSLRDGKSSIDNQTIKEGIVIRSDWDEEHLLIGRKMLKMVSPDYLTRKSKNATEFQ